MKKTLFLATILILLSFNLSAQVSIIANNSVSESEISSMQTESIYSLEQDRWNDGSNLVVFDLRKENVTKNIFYEFIGTSSKKMKKIWLRAKLSGEGLPPTALSSEDDMLEKISSTPGSIGYISSAKVTSSVKVLTTIK